MKDEYVRKQDMVNMFNRAVQDVGILDADDIETVFGMLSSVDVAPVRHGKWILPYETTTMISICSECGAHGNRKGNYCHNCGAKMDA